MNSQFWEFELAKDFDLTPPDPGKRQFRIPLAPGKAAIVTFETEVEVNPRADLQRMAATEEEISLAVAAMEGLACPGSCHRGAKS